MPRPSSLHSVSRIVVACSVVGPVETVADIGMHSTTITPRIARAIGVVDCSLRCSSAPSSEALVDSGISMLRLSTLASESIRSCADGVVVFSLKLERQFSQGPPVRADVGP